QITVEQARFFEHSNVILQALGVQEEVEVQLSKVELKKGDRLMMCSDGLVGVVSDEEISAVVGSIDDPAEAARILIEMANGAGGPDNITVIVAHVGGEALGEATAADALSFAHWRIDPEPPPSAASLTDTFDGFGASTTSPTVEHRVIASPSASSHAARKPTVELMSMAVVIGLILGSIVTGLALYRHGVRCRVAARQPGLAVLSDGHDTGARTGEGAIELRLPPGRHVMSLRAQGTPPFADREVQVERGQMCEVSFTEPSPR
ncbi:MAG TPA: SpoIIE family protein phosphatase, partial [Polyangia bacterium]